MAVKPGVRKRTNKRLDRLDRPKLAKKIRKGGITKQEARKVKRLASKGPKPPKPNKNKPKKKAPYNPTAPLTGKAFDQELNANLRYEFGDEERDINRGLGTVDQQIANTGGYYDQYRAELERANAQIAQNNAANTAAHQQQTNQNFAQQTAETAGRDAEMSKQAALFGRAPVNTVEGYQAADANRQQGNRTVALSRDRGTADANFGARQSANAVQSKAEAVGRDVSDKRKLLEDKRTLARKKGDFKYKFRTDTRDSERQWAAVAKEFELDAAGNSSQVRVAKVQGKAKIKAAYYNLLAAGKYAEAKKVGAKAGISTAKIYSDAKKFAAVENNKNGGGSGGGSGGGGNSVNTRGERRKAAKAIKLLSDNRPGKGQKKAAIDTLVNKYGIPRNAAHAAWRKYVKRFKSQGPTGGNAPGAPGQGSRPT